VKKRLKKRELLKIQKQQSRMQRLALERASVNVTGMSSKEKRFVKRAIKKARLRARKRNREAKIIDSRFPGVSIDHTETLWKSQVYWNNTRIFLGRFLREEDAWTVARNYRQQLGWPELQPMPYDIWKDLGGCEASILSSELPKEFNYLIPPVLDFGEKLKMMNKTHASWPKPEYLPKRRDGSKKKHSVKRSERLQRKAQRKKQAKIEKRRHRKNM